MLTPRQVLDTYYLEARRDLLEIAALFDCYDAAVTREGRTAEDGSKLLILRRALALLADPAPADDRATERHELFAEI
jgi:hypothetical protein